MIAATICWLAPGRRDRWVGVFSGMWRRKEESRQVQVRGRRTSHFALASTDRRVWRRVRACGVNAAGGGRRATGSREELSAGRSARRKIVTISGWRLSRGRSCVDFWVLAGLGGSGWFWGSGGIAVRASVKVGQVFGQAD
jgi:hypothetical protein